MGYRSTLTGVMVSASVILSGPVQAAAPQAMHRAASSATSADTLARNIAGVAHSAEKAHKGPPAARQAEVETAVQNLIATVAPSPAIVKTALERVLASCAPKTDAGKDGMVCPTEAASYVALRNLLGIVTGLLKDFVGDVSNQGPSPFDTLPLPITGGGGADYRAIP